MPSQYYRRRKGKQILFVGSKDRIRRLSSGNENRYFAHRSLVLSVLYGFIGRKFHEEYCRERKRAAFPTSRGRVHIGTKKTYLSPRRGRSWKLNSEAVGPHLPINLPAAQYSKIPPHRNPNQRRYSANPYLSSN